MPEQNHTISDPQRVRALAHPLRLELMELLGMERELTATRCAELTGESVASCSFHLRMLAKYGYVEPGERRGREKPWRLVIKSRTVTRDYGDDASVREVSAFAQLVVDREAERIRRWLARGRTEPPQWTDATPISTRSFWLTADEAKAVADEILELHNRLGERFGARSTDPDKRPTGARRVRLLSALSANPVSESDS